MTTRVLTFAAIKMFVRNRQALFFTLIMPFIFIGIFGLIGFDRVPKIDIGVVISQPDEPTKQFVESLKKVPAFTITTESEAAERQALNKGDRALVMFIPDHLFPAPNVKPTSPQTVKLLKNISQEQQAQTAIAIVTQLFDRTTLSVTGAPELFKLEVENINAKQVKYIDFLLPGIVAMSIMQMAVFSVAFVFTDYKEKGILKRLLATPMKPFQFVTANVITRLLVALFQTAALLFVGSLVFGSHIYGAWWLIALIATLGGIMFLGLGFTISGIAKTVDAVPAVANLIIFPMLFLSGVFFPASSMPDWLQSIVVYFPLSPFAHALREVVANGASISAVAHDLYWMTGWAAVLVVLAIFTFGLEEKRV